MEMYIPSIENAVQRIISAYFNENYSEIREIMEYVLNSSTIAGSENDFHNAAVNLVRMGDYENATLLLVHGLSRYPRSTNILADLLEYGMECRRISEISTYYFDNLSKINKKYWTWRAFHFSIDFLMVYIQYTDNDDQENAVIKEITQLISDYKKFKPLDERAYMVEHDFYNLINQEDRAIKALKEAMDTLKICPQCALNYADMLFEKGEYKTAIPILERTVSIYEDQPSISLGYAYYILALSREYILKNENRSFTEENVKPIFDAYFSALEYLEENKLHLKKEIYKKVHILERETQISSCITEK